MSIATDAEILERLRVLREARGWSLSAVYDEFSRTSEISVSHGTIGKWLNGQTSTLHPSKRLALTRFLAAHEGQSDGPPIAAIAYPVGGMFTLLVTDDAMAPVYHRGDRVAGVAVNLDDAVGHDVIVRHSQAGAEAVQVRHLAALVNNLAWLTTYSPTAEPLLLPDGDIVDLYRVTVRTLA